MNRIIAAILVAALITPALPAFAAESTDVNATRQAARPAVSLRESAKLAVAGNVAGNVAANTDTVSADTAAYGPRSLPRQGSDGVRNQMGGGGGSKVGMIIGLVSAVAGVAATVYVMKQMKKTTDAASAGK